MMISYKSERTKEDIKRTISSILQNMQNPKLKRWFVSILKVEITPDKSLCRVYVSAMAGFDKARKAVTLLQRAKGYVRHELSIRLHLRHTPEIVFLPTDAMDYSENINRILKDLNKEKNKMI